MASGFGVSYQPGQSNVPGRQDQNGGGGGFRGVSPQEAIRILSLRVPERRNPAGAISRDLMMGPGGTAANADAFTSMVAQLMQAFSAPSGPGATGIPIPGREVVNEPPPVAVDTGRIGDDIRPPSMPSPIPTPPGGSGRAPAPRVTPGEDLPEPPPVRDDPTSTGSRTDVTPPPPLTEDDGPVQLPPWLRNKMGAREPLFPGGL